MRCGFDHRHVGTHRLVEIGEFHTDGAGTNDHQIFRQCLGSQRLLVGDDNVVIDIHARKCPRPRTCGDNHVFGGDLRAVTFGIFDHQAIIRFKCGEAFDMRHFVFLEQETDTAIEPG